MDENYIGKRITELRMRKGVSEYKMSRELGHANSYINGIVARKALPALREFLYICEYLEITPKDFFDEEISDPQPLREVYEEVKDLSSEDLLLLVQIIKRMKRK
jgi:transcriptional regulator with XRE-family HTH domain